MPQLYTFDTVAIGDKEINEMREKIKSDYIDSIPKENTYISSQSYDIDKGIRYPDFGTVERSLYEIERLILQNHTIEWRKGNLSMVLNISKFESLIKPLYQDYRGYENINKSIEEDLQYSIDLHKANNNPDNEIKVDVKITPKEKVEEIKAEVEDDNVKTTKKK